MVEDEKLYDHERELELVRKISALAADGGYGLLETAMACRSVMHAALAVMGGNAAEVLLKEEENHE